MDEDTDKVDGVGMATKALSNKAANVVSMRRLDSINNGGEKVTSL